VLDYGPAVFVLLVGAVTIGSHTSASGGRELLLWLAVVASAGALVFRRQAPLRVLGFLLVITLAVDAQQITTLPALIAVFTVAEYCEREKALVAAILTAVVLTTVQILYGHPELFRDVLSHFVAVGLALALGLYLRARADYVGGLRDRAARLERERELMARQAAGQERVRIARELHDVVAHNVSLMVVQAQALAATGAGDSEEKAALGRLAGLGREALSEMHRMLGVLRLETGGAAERAPQPGVAELEGLITRTREAGLDVSLVIEGEPRELPSAVDLSAFRIVQEALTNVIRHAEARHAEVVLNYSRERLLVTVTDDGRGSSVLNGGSSGHGLVGMEERVALFGGRLQAGPGADGRGYRVSASFPAG
jgi:signal transduction histidine kinase